MKPFLVGLGSLMLAATPLAAIPLAVPQQLTSAKDVQEPSARIADATRDARALQATPAERQADQAVT
ncbi:MULTISPECIES: hypothetical protein [unclassified Novosphingobium]|uniref:hypothetical protein n=1 Tax=unclassified Novosphingobium TaxID=2644732 RepID=UPI00135BD0A9|nr:MULTISPECIES: hypothetical protein [unclassified Novosphingobium]